MSESMLSKEKFEDLVFCMNSDECLAASRLYNFSVCFVCYIVHKLLLHLT